MKWSTFLQSLSGHKTIDIIGPFAADWTPSASPVLYVDSGVRWRQTAPLSASVGDGDSSNEALDLRLEREKEFSDFAFALRSLPQNIMEIRAHGFLGGRRDHELANLGEAHAFLSARLMPTRVLWDKQAICWSAGDWDFNRVGIFSIFSFAPTRVTIEGECRYRLRQLTELPALSSFGLSNEASGRVQIHTEGPLLCWFNR